MKVITDPDTGVTRCELHKNERGVLARAVTVLERLAYHLRRTAKGSKADDAADAARTFLEAEAPKPPAK